MAMKVLLLLILIIVFTVDNSIAYLTQCPSEELSSSIRYQLTLTLPRGSTYSGTLLLSPKKNFVIFANVPESESPVSAIQGRWSTSSCNNTLTLTSETLYFFDLPKLSVDHVVCSYTCGTHTDASRSCSVTFTTRGLKATGVYSIAFDLSLPAH